MLPSGLTLPGEPTPLAVPLAYLFRLIIISIYLGVLCNYLV